MATQEQEHIGNDVKGTNNSNYSREKIEGTIFDIVETGEGKFFLAVGMEIMSKEYETRKEVEKYVKEKSWRLITSVILLLKEKTK